MASWLASHSSHWRQLDQPSCNQLSCFHLLQDSSDCQLSCAMGQSKLENEECANCLVLIMLGPVFLPPEAIQAVIQPSTLPGHLFLWCSPFLHKKVGCPKQQASASVKPHRGCLTSFNLHLFHWLMCSVFSVFASQIIRPFGGSRLLVNITRSQVHQSGIQHVLVQLHHEVRNACPLGWAQD